jgi:hypothetical protein
MRTKTDFPFFGSEILEQRLDLRKHSRGKLQKLLPSPLYWWQFPGARKIFWNWVLVQDYLLHGDGPSHQRLVEEYLATLPGSHST